MATEGVRGPGLGTGVKRPAPAVLLAVPRPEPWPLLPSSVKWRRALQAFLRGRRRTQHSWDSFSCFLCSWLQALFLVPSGRSPDAEVTSPAKPSPRCEPSGRLLAFLDTLPVAPSHTWARVPLHAVKTGPREGTCHGGPASPLCRSRCLNRSAPFFWHRDMSLPGRVTALLSLTQDMGANQEIS